MAHEKPSGPKVMEKGASVSDVSHTDPARGKGLLHDRLFAKNALVGAQNAHAAAVHHIEQMGAHHQAAAHHLAAMGAHLTQLAGAQGGVGGTDVSHGSPLASTQHRDVGRLGQAQDAGQYNTD